MFSGQRAPHCVGFPVLCVQWKLFQFCNIGLWKQRISIGWSSWITLLSREPIIDLRDNISLLHYGPCGCMHHHLRLSPLSFTGKILIYKVLYYDSEPYSLIKLFFAWKKAAATLPTGNRAHRQTISVNSLATYPGCGNNPTEMLLQPATLFQNITSPCGKCSEMTTWSIWFCSSKEEKINFIKRISQK